MIAFTVLLNSMVTFILPVGILLIQGNPQSLALATVWLFFIIMGPGVASPIYKLTFLGGNTKEIDEGRGADRPHSGEKARSRTGTPRSATVV